MARNRRNQSKRQSKRREEQSPQRLPATETAAEQGIKRKSKKRQDSPPEIFKPDKTDLENASIMQRTSCEGDKIDVYPRADYREINVFIGRWMICFILLSIFSVSAVGSLGYIDYENVWEILLVPFLTFFAVTESVCLSLWADFKGFLGFILKCASFINTFIIAIFTGFVYSRSYFHIASYHEILWQAAPWLCVVWLLAGASIGIAWFSISDRHNLKFF